ncbi:hypothetical protein GCM10009525_24710 [Streptosporangium amethystogenes subsp. fukuiense]
MPPADDRLVADAGLSSVPTAGVRATAVSSPATTVRRRTIVAGRGQATDVTVSTARAGRAVAATRLRPTAAAIAKSGLRIF